MLLMNLFQKLLHRPDTGEMTPNTCLLASKSALGRNALMDPPDASQALVTALKLVLVRPGLRRKALN